MSPPSADDALTLADAAEALGVTPQRVSQLLSAGDLTGPEYGSRAPKHAPRVWFRSIDEYSSRRREGHAIPRRELSTALHTCEAEKLELHRQLERADSRAKDDLRDDVAAARAAAAVLNVGQSALLDQVNTLIGQVRQLRRTIADKDIELEELQSRYTALELAHESKSDALSQLLIEPRPPDARAD